MFSEFRYTPVCHHHTTTQRATCICRSVSPFSAVSCWDRDSTSSTSPELSFSHRHRGGRPTCEGRWVERSCEEQTPYWMQHRQLNRAVIQEKGRVLKWGIQGKNDAMTLIAKTRRGHLSSVHQLHRHICERHGHKKRGTSQNGGGRRGHHLQAVRGLKSQVHFAPQSAMCGLWRRGDESHPEMQHIQFGVLHSAATYFDEETLAQYVV